MKGRITIRKAVGADGEYVETQVFYLDNKEVTEAEFRAEFPDAPLTEVKAPLRKGRGWPLVCEALGVHPSQVQEATELAKTKGVPTDFRPTGEPVFTSRSHYRDYCLAHNYYMRNAGYGDAAPRSK